MKRRGLWTGLILCLVTACLLAGTALAADTTGTLSRGTITWKLSGTTLTVSGNGQIPDCSETAPAEGSAPEEEAWIKARSAATVVQISEGITGIGNYAFYNCSRLVTLTLPRGLTGVGNYAFSGCSRLSSAPLQYGMKTIGASAFYGCSAMSTAVIPTTTETIGANAFYGTGLKTLIIPSGVKSVGNGAFENCKGLSAIHYGGGSYDKWTSISTGYLPANLHYAEEKLEDETTCNRNLTSRQILRIIRCANCTNLPAPQVEVMDYTLHTPIDVPQKDPTCVLDGYTAYQRCGKCGENLGLPTILPSKGGHKLTETKEHKDPTCTEAGYDKVITTCANPGCVDYPQTTETPIPATGHKEKIETPELAPTCKTDGHTAKIVCETCGKELQASETIPALGGEHKEKVTEEIAKQATCTEKGSKTVSTVCSVCKAVLKTETVEIDLVPHTMPSNPAAVKEEIKALPTCGKDGLVIRTYTCTVCGDDGPKEESIPATGKHTEIVAKGDERVEPTCMASGLTEQVTCSVCLAVLKERENIPRDDNAHPEDEIKEEKEITKPASCTEDGTETITKTCDLCKKVISKETKVIPAAHTFAETDTGTEQIKVNPKCDAPGALVTTKHCTVCDKDIELPDSETPIPALGGPHEFGEWETINDPKEGEPAIQQRTCHKTVGKFTCGHTETRVVTPTKVPTITLNANGGQLPAGASATIKANEEGKLPGTLPTPTLAGCTFKGWFTAALGGEEVKADTVFTEDATIYAHWSGAFTINLDLDSGKLPEGVSSPLKTGDDGKLASLPTPTREGYTFAGWYTAALLGEKVTTDTVFTGSTMIFARWTKSEDPGKSFTLTLDANGGTLAGDTKTVTTGAGGVLAALPKDPTRSGYTFDGWYTAKTGGDKVTTSTVFKADGTIYARWSETASDGTTYAVRLDTVDYGTLTASASKAAKGEKVTIYADPDSGYKLSSMRITDGSGNKVSLTKESDSRFTFTMPGSLVNVTAAFVKDSSSSDSTTGDPSSGSWNNGGSWHPTDVVTTPDPTPVLQSVPQINAAGQAFQDVPPWHWAAGEIAWTSQNGYMNGVGGGAFAPDRNITHQQLWTVLTRLLSYTNVSDANLQAVRQGLLDGGSPGSPTTRQEMVTALYRCAFLLGGARQPSVDIKSFPDSARVSGYAREAMGWAVTNGILTGTADGRLNPTGTVTRAQFAVFLFRFSQRYR